MREQNYYEILGVTKNSTINEIKRAFRRLARKFHPDTNKDPTSKEKFSKIVEAYDTLCDSDLRREYDRLHFPGESDTVYKRKRRSGSYNDFDGETGDRVADMLRSLRAKVAQSEDASRASTTNRFRGSGAVAHDHLPPQKLGNDGPIKRIFQKLFNTSSSTSKQSNIKEKTFSFTIDALESIRGTTRELILNRGENEKKFRVTIPPLITDNAILKINVPGTSSRTDAIQVRVHIVSHSHISRDNNDIYISLPITLAESLVGAEIEIPTLDSPAKLKLAPLSDNGKKYRLKGKGLRDGNGNIGDLYVIPKVVMPSIMSPVIEQAAAAIAQQYSTPVRKDLPKKI